MVELTYIINLQPLQSKINRGCGNSDNKPGLDKQILHDARKAKYLQYNPIINNNKRNIIKLIENTIMYVKQSPLTEPQLAKILSIHKNEVTVLWLYSNYKQNIVWIKIYFRKFLLLELVMYKILCLLSFSYEIQKIELFLFLYYECKI